MGIHDVPKDELIERTAEELKKINEIKPPEWAAFVKTGAHKERPPVREDWWYVRTASVLRKLTVYGLIGVSKLRTKYGGRKNRGVKPEKFYKGSGNIIRKILQQLEKAGLAKKSEKGIHKGRVITPKGASLLEKVSSEIMKEKGIILPKLPKEELKIEGKKLKKKTRKTVRKKKE